MSIHIRWKMHELPLQHYPQQQKRKNRTSKKHGSRVDSSLANSALLEQLLTKTRVQRLQNYEDREHFQVFIEWPPLKLQDLVSFSD